jgi:hypothetical protein
MPMAVVAILGLALQVLIIVVFLVALAGMPMELPG